ncbi:hypothetical protein T8T21_08625 [Limimaricola variabilis]|uniref:hypothetical protein n=1 Tax=Limimaricola variabilis TaxID=1492771 RepID=UPI002AC8FDBB|nr:hypothetical protein [Limimaricola variabilis]WPY93191.1 hypothetical protein T8T21_08625 [Limimaricola variabilis]
MIDMLRASLNTPSGWQPIASAPKDGTPVLLCDGGLIGLFYWGNPGPGRFGQKMPETWIGAVAIGPATECSHPLPPVVNMMGAEATHWAMLPEPPAE